MTSFPLQFGEQYFKSWQVFLDKSQQRSKNVQLLREQIPPLVQALLVTCKQRSCLNVLSVGSGSGEIDLEFLKIVTQELKKSEHGRQMKIFNRAIEPNEYLCRLYKAAIVNLPHPNAAEFDICKQTFEEYREGQKGRGESIKFDFVHFIHSIYHVDIENALVYCFEEELHDNGILICILSGHDLMYSITLKQNTQWHGKQNDKGVYDTAEKITRAAEDNGWKYNIHTEEYSIDVTEVFDEKSTDGNLLLDFLTHTENFRETADKQLVKETLELIEDLTIVNDGKRLGKKRDSLVLIYK